MLAAVQHNHLPCHGARAEDEAHSLADFFRRGASPQRHGCAHPRETRLVWWKLGRVSPGPMPLMRIVGASAGARTRVRVQRADLLSV